MLHWHPCTAQNLTIVHNIRENSKSHQQAHNPSKAWASKAGGRGGRVPPSVKFFRNLPGKSHVMTFFTFSSCDHFSSLTTETDIHFTFTLKLFLTSLSVDNSSHDKKIPTTYWYCIEQSGMHHKENHHCCSTAPETQMTFVLSRPAVYQEYHKIFIIGQLLYLIYNRQTMKGIFVFN